MGFLFLKDKIQLILKQNIFSSENKLFNFVIYQIQLTEILKNSKLKSNKPIKFNQKYYKRKMRRKSINFLLQSISK